jgi:hypothetical protein
VDVAIPSDFTRWLILKTNQGEREVNAFDEVLLQRIQIAKRCGCQSQQHCPALDAYPTRYEAFTNRNGQNGKISRRDNVECSIGPFKRTARPNSVRNARKLLSLCSFGRDQGYSNGLQTHLDELYSRCSGGSHMLEDRSDSE